MEKYKTNIALELIDDIIIEHPNTKEYIEQMAQEKCKREGMLIDKVIFVFFKINFRSKKHFYKPSIS